MAEPKPEQTVTGVSAVNQRGEVMIFIEPARAAPTSMHQNGARIAVLSGRDLLSDEVYGENCRDKLMRRREALVVEVDVGGNILRATNVKVEG